MNETLFFAFEDIIYNTELHVGCLILNSLSSFRNTVPHVRCFTSLTNRPCVVIYCEIFFFISFLFTRLIRVLIMIYLTTSSSLKSNNLT